MQIPYFHLNYMNVSKHDLMVGFSGLELNIPGPEFSLCHLNSLMFYSPLHTGIIIKLI